MLSQAQIDNDIIKNVTIPPRPEALMLVAKEARSADPELSNVVTAILSDVSLSGALLQVVNSPFFGLRNKITTVQQAAGLLGIKKVEKIVTSVSIRSQLSAGVDLGNFWDRIMHIADLAGYLAKKVVGVDPDEAYMLGLFHDCGIPVMMQHFSDYQEVYEECLKTENRPSTAIEIAKYQVHHGMIGHKLAMNWTLPESMCDAILRHHDCLEIFREDNDDVGPAVSLIAILKFAEQVDFEINRDVSGGSNPDWEIIGDSVIEFLGLSQVDATEILDEVRDKIQLID